MEESKEKKIRMEVNLKKRRSVQGNIDIQMRKKKLRRVSQENNKVRISRGADTGEGRLRQWLATYTGKGSMA